MKEEIINGINYHLNEETLTAEVAEKSDGYEGAIVIPETVVLNEVTYRVTSIGERAFFRCDLLNFITITNSVMSIGKSAFFRCKELDSIRFGGTIAQWKQIELGIRWKYRSSAKLVLCTDGDLEIYRRCNIAIYWN
jgi:hypothetical protein